MKSIESAETIAEEMIRYYRDRALQWLRSTNEPTRSEQLDMIANRLGSLADNLQEAVLAIPEDHTMPAQYQIVLSSLCDTIELLRNTSQAIRTEGMDDESLAEHLGWASAVIDACNAMMDAANRMDEGFSVN